MYSKLMVSRVSSLKHMTVQCIYRISGNVCCKNIFVVAINHENIIHEIIFTRVNS